MTLFCGLTTERLYSLQGISYADVMPSAYNGDFRFAHDFVGLNIEDRDVPVRS